MFHRFSPAARDVVRTAQTEARLLGHRSIGTEHLLLALSTAGSGAAGAALDRSGATPDAIRTEIVNRAGPDDEPATENIPLSPESKTVLELSLRESLRLKHKTIQPAHILLGLIRKSDGAAARILLQLGINLETLRAEVVDEMRGAEPPSETGPRTAAPMTPGAAAALDTARSLAGGRPLGSQHLLGALVDGNDTLAALALDALGVTREAVDEQLGRLDATGTADELPEDAAARRTTVEVDAGVVTVRMEDPDLAAKLTSAVRERSSPLVIRGTEVPDFERFWWSVRPALEEMGTGFSRRTMVRRLTETAEVTGPGDAMVAEYAVVSRPGGPASRLVLNRRLATEEQVRLVVAGWLARHGGDLAATPGRHDESGCVRLAVHVGHARDTDPGAGDPLALTVTGFAYGAGPAPPDHPRVPLADLVAFAVNDLRGSGAPGPPG